MLGPLSLEHFISPQEGPGGRGGVRRGLGGMQGFSFLFSPIPF